MIEQEPRSIQEQPLVASQGVVLFEAPLEFGDKGNRGRPPPKIRGSQFVKREEKKQSKLPIRTPFIEKNKSKNKGSTIPPS